MELSDMTSHRGGFIPGKKIQFFELETVWTAEPLAKFWRTKNVFSVRGIELWTLDGPFRIQVTVLNELSRPLSADISRTISL